MKSLFNLFILITSLQFTETFATKEDDLRNVLLKDYNKYTRPLHRKKRGLIKGNKSYTQRGERIYKLLKK